MYNFIHYVLGVALAAALNADEWASQYNLFVFWKQRNVDEILVCYNVVSTIQPTTTMLRRNIQFNKMSFDEMSVIGLERN